MEQLHIRRLRDADEDVLAGLRALIAQISPSAASLDRERAGSVIEDQSTAVFVAERAGRILGTASVAATKTLSEEKGHVEDVVVDHMVRRNGIGTALIRAVLDHARSVGLHYVDLTSRPEREAANAFYVRLGFEPRHTNVYRYEVRR